MQRPSLGRIVHYRGKQGLQTRRAAIVTADVDSLDPRGVELGTVPPLSSPTHVHLWVYTPGLNELGGFQEFDVPWGGDQLGEQLLPGTWVWPPRV